VLHSTEEALITHPSYILFRNCALWLPEFFLPSYVVYLMNNHTNIRNYTWIFIVHENTSGQQRHTFCIIQYNVKSAVIKWCYAVLASLETQ
jgi:hypothetical protein